MRPQGVPPRLRPVSHLSAALCLGGLVSPLRSLREKRIQSNPAVLGTITCLVCAKRNRRITWGHGYRLCYLGMHKVKPQDSGKPWVPPRLLRADFAEFGRFQRAGLKLPFAVDRLRTSCDIVAFHRDNSNHYRCLRSASCLAAPHALERMQAQTSALASPAEERVVSHLGASGLDVVIGLDFIGGAFNAEGAQQVAGLHGISG